MSLVHDIATEIEAVVDRLHSEGHVIAVRLENALKGLKDHLLHIEKTVEEETAPVVEAVKSEVPQVVEEVKTEAATAVAEAVDTAQGK